MARYAAFKSFTKQLCEDGISSHYHKSPMARVLLHQQVMKWKSPHIFKSLEQDSYVSSMRDAVLRFFNK